MKYLERPASITTILKTIASGNDSEISTELETYIVDLEAKQPERPSRIAAILETIRSAYPADVKVSLEAYISNLEANQQAVPSENNQTPSWDPNNPPIWSQQRHNERAQHRREHALRKQHDYQ